MRQGIRGLSLLVCLVLAACASVGQRGENLAQARRAAKIVARQAGAILITTMVPEQASAESWTEAVTTQIYVGLKTVSPAEFQAESRRKWLDECRRGSSPRSPAARKTAIRCLCGCFRVPTPKLPGHPEYAWFKAIRGSDNFYVIQKASRFRPSNAQVAESMQFLKAMKVCDDRVPARPLPPRESRAAGSHQDNVVLFLGVARLGLQRDRFLDEVGEHRQSCDSSSRNRSMTLGAPITRYSRAVNCRASRSSSRRIS